jgi:hypothetical protein
VEDFKPYPDPGNSGSSHACLVAVATLGPRPWFADLVLGRIVAQSFWRLEQRAETLAYCIMPVRCFWILRPAPAVPLPDTVRALKTLSAHRINRVLARKGRLWRKGMHYSPLRSDGEISKAIHEILAFPVRSRLVRRPELYPLAARITGIFADRIGEAEAAAWGRDDGRSEELGDAQTKPF